MNAAIIIALLLAIVILLLGVSTISLFVIAKHVSFVEKLRGPMGHQGPMGYPGPPGLQGNDGPMPDPALHHEMYMDFARKAAIEVRDAPPYPSPAREDQL